MISAYNPDIMVILEPKISGVVAESVCKSFVNFSCTRVEANSFKGGIWVFWQENRVTLTEICQHNQAFHFRISKGLFSGLFTAVYGSPQRGTRKELWQFLESIAPVLSEPWFLIGDFNEILSEEEKTGGAPFNPSSASLFLDTMNSCQLLDLGSSGPKFTWRGPSLQRFRRIF